MPFACVGLDWARPCVPLPKDRIDQIAAATAVASTDRSKSRWKQKNNEQKEEEALPINLNPINKPL
jgi:hypothetical protein